MDKADDDACLVEYQRHGLDTRTGAKKLLMRPLLPRRLTSHRIG